MELNDSLARFQPKQGLSISKPADGQPCLRIGILSERIELSKLLERLPKLAQFNIRHVRSVQLLERAIEERYCDVAIVDIDREDCWPESVFRRFDEAAANFPIIMLCKRKHQVRNYLRIAQHVFDVFPYDIVIDSRFFNLIQAAKLRDEVISGLDLDKLEPLPDSRTATLKI